MLLHKHNKETYQKMVSMFKRHNRVVAVQPTGTGKSFLILQLIKDNPDKKFLISSPSSFIFSQLKTYADKYGIVLSNCKYYTYSKLSGMEFEDFTELVFDYIVLDEIHRCGAVEWSKGIEHLLDAMPDAKVFGTSATPIRYLDSFRNMAEELFDGNYAVDMSLSEAIRQKLLPMPIYITAWYSFSGDIAKLEKRAEKSDNPYFKMVLHKKLQKAKSIIADLDCGIEKIFEKHMTNRSGKYIVFCADTKRLEQIIEEAPLWFENVNTHIHKYAVYSQNAASKNEFDLFRDDEDDSALKLLFCVNMLNEGVHVEGIDGVIMLRATQSANVFYQQLGRALSCSSGKRPLIFDIVNNYETGDTAKQYAEIMELGRHYGNGAEYDIQFELYDYVKDIRDILEEMRNTFENSWEVVYKVLEEFFAKYNRFPSYDEEYQGYKLGVWCSNQRVLRNSGDLAQERIALLDALGFIWNSKDERWMNSFYQTKAYYEKHGCFPTSGNQDKEAVVVSSWIRNQRQLYKKGKLNEKRISFLRSIDIITEPVSAEEKWEIAYQALASYVKENNHFPTASNSKESEEIYIMYRWMLRQRSAKNAGKLTEERVEKLDSIDFVWSFADELWNQRFDILQEYVKQYHRLPSSKAKMCGECIGQWYIKQRKRYEKGCLSPSQRIKLESLECFN